MYVWFLISEKVFLLVVVYTHHEVVDVHVGDVEQYGATRMLGQKSIVVMLTVAKMSRRARPCSADWRHRLPYGIYHLVLFDTQSYMVGELVS